MKIKVTSEDELIALTQEALFVLVNMRHHQRIQNGILGGQYIQNKKRWEKKADEFLEKIESSYIVHKSHIKINIEEPVNENT